MARILTISPDDAHGLRRLLLAAVKRQTGGVVPGMTQILLANLALAVRTLWLTVMSTSGSGRR